MDIEGLGDRTVAQLIASGLVEDPADIYALTVEQLLSLDGFATDQRREARRRHRRVADEAVATAAHGPGHQAPRPRRRRCPGGDVRHPRCGDERTCRGPRRGPRCRRSDRCVDPHVVRPRQQSRVHREAARRRSRLRRGARARPGQSSPRRSPARRSWCRARSAGSAARVPPKRSWRAAGRAPAASARRPIALVVGDSPGASKVTKAEQHGVPIIDEAAFERLLETGELPT